MRDRQPVPLCAALLAIAAASFAVGPASAGADEPGEYTMTTFQLVMLWSGDPKQPLAAAEEEARQRAHLKYLERLVDDGTAVLTGPLKEGGELRGIVVLAVEDTAAAEAVMAKDPWVEAGYLKPELHTWWAAEGILRKPPVFLDLESAWLGLLRRPADAPSFSDTELAELQRGHMANINAMAESGELVIAGPMAGDGALRGIFVFRGGPEAQVREMVARDPSIQARRLEMELLEWMISKGALPAR